MILMCPRDDHDFFFIRGEMPIKSWSKQTCLDHFLFIYSGAMHGFPSFASYLAIQTNFASMKAE